MTRLLLLLLFLSFGLSMQSYAQGQDQMPREYVNPDEVISFDRGTDFQDAIEILSIYAQDSEEKFILDRTGTTGAIATNALERCVKLHYAYQKFGCDGLT